MNSYSFILIFPILIWINTFYFVSAAFLSRAENPGPQRPLSSYSDALFLLQF